jgi:enoyl-CoA hydratase/carnithine racemase
MYPCALGGEREALWKDLFMSETHYQVTNQVATITLNRPDKLNAWTAVMDSEVRSHLAEAEHDDHVRIIVLTGAGRGFCAGADMSLLSSVASQGIQSDQDAAARLSGSSPQTSGILPDFQKKYSYFLGIEKPILAGINGHAVGLGLVIALYCDLRLASDAARFSTTFAQRGLIAEYGMAWMLPRIVGLANALDLLYSARTIDSTEALRLGLVNQVFAQESFIDKINEYAAGLASRVSPRSLRVIKRQVYAAMFQTLGESFDLALAEMIASLKSEDFKEGVAHFLEKRVPRFPGK